MTGNDDGNIPFVLDYDFESMMMKLRIDYCYHFEQKIAVVVVD
jgi:hypothetical protein